MKCKKLTALVLTGVMTLSLAVPAFAIGTKITGAYEEITIDVTLNDVSTAAINPFSMPVKALADDETELKELTTAGKIATQPLVMYNGTEIDLNVGATVTTTMGKNATMTLVSDPIEEDSTDKAAQVFLEFKRDTTLAAGDIHADSESTTINGVDGAKVIKAFNNWSATTYSEDNANQILLESDTAVSKENLAILSAGKLNGSEVDPETGSFILYRLAGDAVKNPDEAWSKNDTFDVNIAFSFSPVEVQKGGSISMTETAKSGPKVKVAAPSKIKLEECTISWEILDAGNTAIDGYTAESTAGEATLTSTETLAAGAVELKCTVRDKDGNVYVSTGTFNVTES